ncbi:MAG: hypothetical protein CM15mP108_3430 [Gammaproteobacteria bacterium]|nr:MAG: hypothetical protein CM15mP108_3430 [Gammaproteobacteria bacterium]
MQIWLLRCLLRYIVFLLESCFFILNQIGAAILETAVVSLQDMGAESGDRLAMYSGSALSIGGPLQTALVLLIVVFQLAITWRTK